MNRAGRASGRVYRGLLLLGFLLGTRGQAAPPESPRAAGVAGHLEIGTRVTRTSLVDAHNSEEFIGSIDQLDVDHDNAPIKLYAD